MPGRLASGQRKFGTPSSQLATIGEYPQLFAKSQRFLIRPLPLLVSILELKTYRFLSGSRSLTIWQRIRVASKTMVDAVSRWVRVLPNPAVKHQPNFC